MTKKLKIGILITNDVTMDGKIMSEFLYFNAVYEKQKQYTPDLIVDLITLSKNSLRLVERYDVASLEGDSCFDFPHKTILVTDDIGIERVSDEYDILITTRNYGVIFGGMLSGRSILQYKLSNMFSRKNKPVMIRVTDSEDVACDYLKLAMLNIDGMEKNIKDKNPEAYEQAKTFVETQQFIDYNNVYWLANGSPKINWLYDTVLNKKSAGPLAGLVSEDVVKRNTIYLSDDIFFLVKENHSKYGYLDKTVPKNNSFCFIGFLSGINKTRLKVFNNLLKENPANLPPIHFFGDVDKLSSDIPVVDIEQGSILGNSPEYFEFINNHLAYLFVGKGRENISYVGKTCYDSLVARTPIVVYSKCDVDRVMFPNNPEFYFDNVTELAAMYELLQDNMVRSKWVDIQTKVIFKELDVEPVDFSLLC
jgi:hypothetical protein